MFIYNFTRLIEFPSQCKTGDYIIGVLGSDVSFNEIKNFSQGKTVGTQTITVKKFNSIDDVTNCHILFVSFSKTKELAIIISKIEKYNTLLITEKNGATSNGSIINFVILDDKLKFEVNPDNALKFQIKLSTKLTEMAYKLI
jgi:hypothetical protein